MRPKPLAGHVHLVLFEQKPNPFYLEIPLGIIEEVCRHPPKYLSYLGWCVLGAEGSLQDERGEPVDLDSELADGGVYHYRLSSAGQGCLSHFLCDLEADRASDVLFHAVDLEVIKLRSEASTQTTRTRSGFCQELAPRDGEQCVWTGFRRGCEGMHIIPWSKGDEWLQLIIQNRPHGGERRLEMHKRHQEWNHGQHVFSWTLPR
ncbi:hypothetical protein HD554DRAFT_1711940 [Boletus coccyginus]|nr:hypothetical protein HD554DRAFT_1711940 [Boletus coccyginus]